VIAGHYWLLRSDPSLIRLNAGQAVALAETVDGVQVRLDRLDRFAHEGELTLSLFRGEQRLYTLVFTLGQIRAERVVYVGALQGLQSPDALEIYRALTQGMHGLRPRDLLLTAFRECCACLDIRRILAVSDRCRVSSSPYFKSSAQVLTSYDSAWIESGGHPADDGFFELARSVDRRGAADIPTRKRAAYRRRYAMVDGVLAQIRLSLGVL
jgi:uncharacterized protein VirK/YbjX